MNKRRIATLMIFPLLVLTLMACESDTLSGSGSPLAYPTLIPLPLPDYNQEAAYAAAQVTLAAGQSQIAELSHQATMVSLDENQAAHAAAQATNDDHQRQLMELSIRGTDISQNIAWAAATQQFITDQTQSAWNTTATAQSQAAAATYSANVLNVTQAAYNAQVNATQSANSLTATPFAALQAQIVQTRNESDRRAWWGEFVVTPLRVFLITLIVLLLIAGGVMAYRRLMPVLELRLRTISRGGGSSVVLLDGMFVETAPQPPQLPSDGTPQVEIVGSSEPAVTNWITEAEQKLRAAAERTQP